MEDFNGHVPLKQADVMWNWNQWLEIGTHKT
jgi:hypothetical protein